MKTKTNIIKHTISICGAIGVATISFLWQPAPKASATCVINNSAVSCDETVDAAVTVPKACTMSSILNSAHSAEVDPGTFKSDGIGQTTIKVICNDSAGYAVYVAGYTGDEIGGTNSTNLIGTNSNIATGTATSGEISNWSMKLAAVSGDAAPTIENGFSAFSSIPSSYTKVASFAASTANPDDPSSVNTGSSLTTTYGAFISATQTAGSYNGKVKYTLVHPSDETPVTPLSADDCPANSICYAPNSFDLDGSMDSISSTKIATSATAGVQAAASNTDIDLISSNYNRSGYGFAGWSTDFEANNFSTIFGPNETITTGDLSTNGLILYPVWVAATGTLQSWNGCSSLTTAPTATRATLSSVTALVDQRDGNTYTVARLADGNCWTTENLRLNAANSYNASLAQGFGEVFVGLDESENDNFAFSSQSTPNNMYTNNNITGGDKGYRFPRYNNTNTNRSLNASYNATGENGTYYHWLSYGNYYNWPAAIANTAYIYTNNQSTTSTSLCPTGWTLPIGGDKDNLSNSDFWKLIVNNINGGTNPANYGSNPRPYYSDGLEGTAVSQSIRSFPNDFIYAGEFTYSEAVDRNVYGSYWSSTAYNFGSSYRLYFNGSYVEPGTGTPNKTPGAAVRCLTRTS